MVANPKFPADDKIENCYSPPHLLGVLDQENETPLQKAAKNGHSGIVEILLTRSPPKESGPRPDREKAMNLAASNGHVGVLGLLNFHVSPRTSPGTTPLISAAAAGHAQAVQWLLENEAGTTVVNEDEWLLENEAGTTVVNEDERLRKIWAIIAMGDDWYEAIEVAIINGHEEVVQTLLDYDGQKEWSAARQRVYVSLLVLAARKRQKDILATLVEHYGHGYDPILRRTYLRRFTQSAERYATKEKQPEAAQLLKEVREAL